MTPEIIPRKRTKMTGFVTDCTIRRFTPFRTEFSRERISLRKERKRRGTWHFSSSLCKQSQRTMNHTARKPRIPGGDDKVLDYRGKKTCASHCDENGLKCPARTKLIAFVINEWNDETSVYRAQVQQSTQNTSNTCLNFVYGPGVALLWKEPCN